VSAILGVFVLLFGLILPFVWFGGMLALFPVLAFTATCAVGVVGLLNSKGRIHAREHFLDMLPGMITVIVIVAIISATR